MFPFPPVVRSFLFSLFERAWLRTALCFCLCATVCASCSVDRHMEKKAGEDEQALCDCGGFLS